MMQRESNNSPSAYVTSESYFREVCVYHSGRTLRDLNPRGHPMGRFAAESAAEILNDRCYRAVSSQFGLPATQALLRSLMLVSMQSQFRFVFTVAERDFESEMSGVRAEIQAVKTGVLERVSVAAAVPVEDVGRRRQAFEEAVLLSGCMFLHRSWHVTVLPAASRQIGARPFLIWIPSLEGCGVIVECSEDDSCSVAVASATEVDAPPRRFDAIRFSRTAALERPFESGHKLLDLLRLKVTGRDI